MSKEAPTRTDLVRSLAEWLEQAEEFEESMPRSRNLLRPPDDAYDDHYYREIHNALQKIREGAVGLGNAHHVALVAAGEQIRPE